MKFVILFVLNLFCYSNSFKSLFIRKNNYRLDSFKIFAKPCHKVTIQHNGVDTVLSIPEDVSILSAALDAGIELPYDCKLGVCLTCPSKVVSGKVDQSEGTLEDSVKEEGYYNNLS